MGRLLRKAVVLCALVWRGRFWLRWGSKLSPASEKGLACSRNVLGGGLRLGCSCVEDEFDRVGAWRSCARGPREWFGGPRLRRLGGPGGCLCVCGPPGFVAQAREVVVVGLGLGRLP